MSALTPLELSVAMVLGSDGSAALPATASGPLEALEAAMLGSLRRSPCLVSFSGGRDSSAVLAVATRLARREGLADPIPATIRAPASRAADESRWQELVVAHLGLDDWMQLEVGDELDVVGPVAQHVLRRHGLLWPLNAHFHLPLLEAAQSEGLLIGISAPWRGEPRERRALAALLASQHDPRAAVRDHGARVEALAPGPARRHGRRRAEVRVDEVAGQRRGRQMERRPRRLALDRNPAVLQRQLRPVGPVAELTQGCDKTVGSSDGFTFQGQGIVCRSA